MKKTKILTVLGILLAMGITACTPAQSQSGDKQSQGGDASQPAGESEEHKHVYGDWVQTVAPTCTEKGKEEQTCACGDKKERDVKALGHDWGEWTAKTAATCTTDGSEERTCKRAGCGAKEEHAVKAAHDWDAEQAVAAGTDPADQVGYSLTNCKKGDAVKVDVKAVDAKFYKGKIKSGTPEGYFKLNSTNDKAYWKFTVPGTKMYKGMLYERGAMDSFSSNTERSYAQTSTSGDHAPKYPLGNFDVKVNGDSLDKSQWIDVPFSELLADGEDSAAMGDNYSPLCLCPIGECVIQAGLNEITYERLGSYNLIISDLIFIGAEYEHVHAAATEWSSDDTNHWHACTAMGCPTGKLDVVAHTFGDWVENKAATCKEAGERQHTCTVCGKVVKEEVAKLAHTLGEAHDVVPATCQAAGSQKKTCSVCNEVITEVLPKSDHVFGEAVENYPAVTEGENQHIGATAHNCANCDKAAIRWSALDFDATLSSGTSKVKVNGSATENAVKTGDAENNGGQGNANPAVSVGNHYVYKVNVPAAVEKAGLAFRVFTRTSAYPVFKTQSNDGKRGNYYNAETQQFTAAPARYGVRINGQEVYFDEKLLEAEGNAATSKDLWFDFPLNSFSLVAGVNTIDVYSMGGYSQQGILEFQVTGVAHVTPSHLHNGEDTWLSDNTHHWHVCSAAGCPIADGVYGKAAHTFVKDETASSDPTTTANGKLVEKCSVCGKVKETVIPALSIKEWVKDDLASALPENHGLTTTTYANGIVGYKFNKADKAIATFKYTPAAAGTYTLRLLLSPKDGNQASTGFWKYNGNAKSKVTVNGEEIAAPANDVDMSVCTVKSATAKDGTSVMREPVWFDIANVTLTAGENTIVVQFVDGSYSYFLCGAAIANVIA